MHRHHIIPRHAGGSDDPSNIVELTVDAHAEEHRKLYEKHGREQDRLAYLALSGQMKKSDIVKKARKLGRKSADLHLEATLGPDWRTIIGLRGGRAAGVKAAKLKLGYCDPKNQRKGVLAALKSSSKKKRKASLKKIKHQQGFRNSVYGKHWYTDGTSSIMAKVCPQGWKPGRT